MIGNSVFRVRTFPDCNMVAETLNCNPLWVLSRSPAQNSLTITRASTSGEILTFQTWWNTRVNASGCFSLHALSNDLFLATIGAL